MLKPESNSSIAIFGVGAVGLSAIMEAKIAGYKNTIAVALHDNRLEFAEELGATATMNSGNVDIVVKGKEITKTGVQNALDTTGVDTVIEQAVEWLATLGKLASVGTDDGFTILFENLVLGSKRIVGSTQGDEAPQELIQKMISYYKDGIFPFDRMVIFDDCEQINEAFEDPENGSVIKLILKMN